MGVFNEQNYVRESIQSMLTQTFSDFEFIIINDASTDKTEEIIWAFDDSRIKYIKNDINIGLTKTLNKGLSLAKGKYIARMDGNDIAYPTRLEKEVKVMDSNPNLHLVWTGLKYITSKGKHLCNKKSPSLAEVVNLLYSSPTDLPVGRNHINHITVMFRKDTVLEMDGYNEKYRWGQDGNLWYRMLHKGFNFYFINQPLLSKRIIPESVTFNRNGRNLFSPAEIYASTCLANHAWRKTFLYLSRMPLGIKKVKLTTRTILTFLWFLF